MAAVDVDDRNFRYWLPHIKKSIEEAVFVCIDCEFLGLPSALRTTTASLFDTSCDRYGKLRDAVRRFPPCQIGLACYQEGDDVATYRADVFCITLFKRVPQKDFSISPSAITFLADHKFDFNKFALYGLNYCSQHEIAYLKNAILSGEFDLELFGYEFDDRMRSIKMSILLEDVENEAHRCETLSGSTNTLHLKRPLVIELYREREDFAIKESLWDQPLSSLEEAAILFILSQEYPDLEFHIDSDRTLLYVGKRPLMYGNVLTLDRVSILNNILREISGVSQIFQYLSIYKPPLVGHNCLLDLMYVHNYFDDELPEERMSCSESYALWKKQFHEKFPVIIDTKFLAETLKDTLYSHGVVEFSLPSLGDFFALRSLSGIFPIPISLAINNVKSDLIFEVKNNYHNAGFDALITGFVFIKLAHLFVNTRNRFLPSCVALSKPHDTVFIGSDTVTFFTSWQEGEDAPGRRPDIIEIRSRRRFTCAASAFISANVGTFIMNAVESVVGFPKISAQELHSIRNELIRRFGAYRVDVRFGTCRRSLEIATNSASTYARVCSFFDANDVYCFTDEKERTFEQRLCSPRVGKNSITKNSLSTFPKSVLVILVSITFPPLIWTTVRLMRA